MTQPQPKTQAELQARVLEVLRRAYPKAFFHASKEEFELGMDADDVYGGCLTLSGNGYCCDGFGSEQLDALAEASRLLRDGVAAPSRLDRALEVLRAAGYSDAHAVQRTVYLGKDDTTYLSRATSDGYGFESDCGISLGPVKFGAIAQALEIFNAPGDE